MARILLATSRPVVEVMSLCFSASLNDLLKALDDSASVFS